MDKIHIRDLSLRCIIGTYPEEREKKQDVLINISLDADLKAAGLSDQLEDTVNYKAIKLKVIETVEASEYQLIEKMAEKIAAICLEDPKVHGARVIVDKPGALRFARSAAVEIYRTRD